MRARSTPAALVSPSEARRRAAGAEALEDLLSETMVFLHGAARREGLTLVQIMVLKLLEKRAPLSPSALADLLGISRPAITSSINILEAGGWVVRLHPEGDRRRLETTLRPKAQHILARLVRARRAFLGTGLARIDPPRRAEFLATAAELAEHLRIAQSGEDRESRGAP
jgi:DNA-binding MarR family transcriptional regulator